MKAVCTTFGCCAAAAAPMPGPLLLLELLLPFVVALFAADELALDIGALAVVFCCWLLD